MLQILADAFAAALERRRAERHRQELEAQVLHSQKLESLGVMAGGIAHDFNNLLTGILGAVGLAQMQHGNDGPLGERLAQVEQAALRAAELTNQMLAYSGRGRSRLEVLDLSAVVRDMAHLLETVLSKKATLRFEFGEEPPRLRGDPGQIRQIVMNLLTNASESLEGGAGTITVRTGRLLADEDHLSQGYLQEEVAPGPYVSLEVTDTGCGMGRETLERIFDPFFTTKFTGRGLGLAAVLGIVRGHGGTIRVRSEPGEGTSFQVLFPSARAAEDRPAGQEEASAGAEEPGGTILVVDDEELVRSTAGMILEQAGYRVVLAGDGREGVETFRNRAKEIDAVVLDLSMPEMSGEEVFRELRALRPDVQVLLSSGYSQEEAVTRLAGEGLAGFIAKPFRASTLLSSVREVLARRS
jgi:nitrogen-specific signal transduction histidine kinase/ActR/RegA family two-component response regulator